MRLSSSQGSVEHKFTFITEDGYLCRNFVIHSKMSSPDAVTLCPLCGQR